MSFGPKGGGGGGSTDIAEQEWANGATSEVPNGASAVAFPFNDPSYTTAGSKLIEATNNGDEAFSVGYNGVMHLENYSSGTIELDPFIGGIVGNNILRLRPNTGNSGEFLFDNDSSYIPRLEIVAAASAFINIKTQTGDFAASTLTISAGAALASASTNIDGGSITIEGGNGASSSSGDADGGAANLVGGQGYGTGDGGNAVISGGAANGSGTKGLIVLDLNSLPTADPGVNGALWLNAGTLTVSGS